MASMYYALTVAPEGPIDHGTFCSLTPEPPLEILQGGWTIYPTSPSMTSVTIYPQTVQMQWPPSANIAGGVTIVTSAPRIAGTLMVSPPVGTPVVVTLYGIGGQPIGDAAIEPGQTEIQFGWIVDSAQSIPEGELAGVLEKITGERRRPGG